MAGDERRDDLPMTLQEHLGELRGRLITIAAAIVAGLGGGLTRRAPRLQVSSKPGAL